MVPALRFAWVECIVPVRAIKHCGSEPGVLPVCAEGAAEAAYEPASVYVRSSVGARLRFSQCAARMPQEYRGHAQENGLAWLALGGSRLSGGWLGRRWLRGWQCGVRLRCRRQGGIGD